MESVEFSKAVNTLVRKVVLIENRAHEVSARFQALGIEVEVLKTDILKRQLEKKTKSLARQAGYASMGKNSRNLGIGLVAGVAGLILGGVVNRDRLSALAFAMSGFDGALQEMGKSEWAVSFDVDFFVVPRNQIAPGRTWVTMESLLIALEGLKEKARGGEQCGNLDSVIEKLKHGHSKLVRLVSASQWVPIPRNSNTSG